MVWIHKLKNATMTMAVLNEQVQNCTSYTLYITFVSLVAWYMILDVLICGRKPLDYMLPHNNSCDRIWGALLSLVHSSDGLDCWSCCHALLQCYHSLYRIISCWLLSCWWLWVWKKKLYFHGCSSQHSW